MHSLVGDHRKVFLSGAAVSDLFACLWCCFRLTNMQFSLEELTAICQEAAAAGTYVAAHAYTPPAIKRALAAGVRSIEHGNW